MRVNRGLVSIAAAAGLFIASAAMAAESTETFDFEGFRGIQVDGHVELDVTAGEKFSIEISGAESDMEKLVVEVEDGVLLITRERGKRRRRANTPEFHAKITMPEITSISIDGMSDATIKNIDSAEFLLSVDGHGEMILSGKCGRLVIEVDGHAEIEGRELECSDVSLEVDGHGEIEVYAGETLALDINGHGDVDVYGGPRISKFRKSGHGSFEIKE